MYCCIVFKWSGGFCYKKVIKPVTLYYDNFFATYFNTEKKANDGHKKEKETLKPFDW